MTKETSDQNPNTVESKDLKSYLNLLGIFVGVTAVIFAYLWGVTLYGIGSTALYLWLYLCIRALARVRRSLSKNNEMYKDEQLFLKKLQLSHEQRLNKLINIIFYISILLTLPFLYRTQPVILTILHIYHWFMITVMFVIYVFPESISVMSLVQLFIEVPFGVFFAIFSKFKNVITFIFKKSEKLKKVFTATIVVIASLLISYIMILWLSEVDEVFKLKLQWLTDSRFVSSLLLRSFLYIVAIFVASGIFIKTLTSIQKILDIPVTKKTDELVDKILHIKTFSDFVSILVVVFNIPILLVYYLFLYVQFRYLFAGEDLVKIAGKYTYAEYASKGVFELFVVSSVGFFILLLTQKFAKNKNKLIKIANIGVIISSFLAIGLMLFSSLKRFLYYERAYGLTDTRLMFVVFIGVFIIMIIAWAFLSIKKILNPDYRIIYARYLGDDFWLGFIGVLIVLVIISIIPLNNIILLKMKSNYVKTGKIDAHYVVYRSSVEDNPVLYSIAKVAKDKHDDVFYNMLIGKIRQDYKLLEGMDDKGSIFSRVGHLNLAIIKLKIINNRLDTVDTAPSLGKVDNQVEFLARETVKNYIKELNKELGMHGSHFPEIAKKYWSPKMKVVKTFKMSSNSFQYHCTIDPDTISTGDLDISFSNTLNIDRSFELLQPRLTKPYLLNDAYSFFYKITCTYYQYSGKLKPKTYTGRAEVTLIPGLNGFYIIDDEAFPLAYIDEKFTNYGYSNGSLSVYRYNDASRYSGPLKYRSVALYEDTSNDHNNYTPSIYFDSFFVIER